MVKINANPLQSKSSSIKANKFFTNLEQIIVQRFNTQEINSSRMKVTQTISNKFQTINISDIEISKYRL